MRRFLILFLCAPVIGLLAGPATGSQKLPVPYEKDILFDSGDFSFVGGPHELRTALYGNLFGADGAALQAEVIAAMQTTNWYWRAVKPNVTFVDGPGSEEWRSLHVAVYLNAEPLEQAADYCAAAGKLEFLTLAAPLSVRMVFCNGRELYSTTVATLADVTGAGDGAFHKLLVQMTRGLWPLRYLDVQMGSSQILLEYRQSNLTYPELFGFGFNTVRKLLGPNGRLRHRGIR